MKAKSRQRCFPVLLFLAVLLLFLSVSSGVARAQCPLRISGWFYGKEGGTESLLKGNETGEDAAQDDLAHEINELPGGNAGNLNWAESNREHDGGGSVTSDPRSVSYPEWLAQAGNQANEMAKQALHENETSSSDEIEKISNEAREFIVNAANQWMAANPEKMSQLTLADWAKLGMIQAGPTVDDAGIATVTQNAFESFATHNPGVLGQHGLSGQN